MDMDALITLVSLISFFVLVAFWITAPLRAEPVTALESAHTAAA